MQHLKYDTLDLGKTPFQPFRKTPNNRKNGVEQPKNGLKRVYLTLDKVFPPSIIEQGDSLTISRPLILL